MTSRIETPRGRPHPELISDKTSSYNDEVRGIVVTPIKNRIIASIDKSISRMQRGGRQGELRGRTYSVYNLDNIVQVSATRTHLLGKTAAELSVARAAESPHEPVNVSANYSAGDFANLGDGSMFDYMRSEGPLQEQGIFHLGCIATTMRRAAKATVNSPSN